MRITKAALKAGYDGSFNNLIAVVRANGGTVLEGVTVKPGDTVTAKGYKHKTYVVMPKGTDRSGRAADSISVARPDGSICHIRASKTTTNDGNVAGLFLGGQPVVGYAD